jgi:signal transduction histidine kinase/ligand-binding sensor domain-containing protein
MYKYLYLVKFLLLFLFVSGCQSRKGSPNDTRSTDVIYQPPVKVSLDSVPPPIRIELKNVPPPTIVLASAQAIVYSHGKSLTPISHFTNFNTEDGLPSEFMYGNMIDKKGQLWFSTGNYVGRYQPSSNGPSFVSFKVGLGSPVNHILEDKKGNIWFSTWGSGVCRYDGINFTNYTTNEGLAHNLITKAMEDKNGNIWFASGGGGISRFDGKTFKNFNTQNGLSSNFANTILQDNSGNFWIGSGDVGVDFFDGKAFKSFSIKQGLVHNTVFSIIQDKAGILWFGTQEGISRMDPSQGKPIFTTLKLPDQLLIKNTNSIVEDDMGNLWFSMYGGGVCKLNLNLYDSLATRLITKSQKNEDPFTIFTKEQGLADNYVSMATKDRNGNLWFCTDAGISRYNGETVKLFTTSQGLPTRILSGTEDKEGNLWFGSYQEGIYHYTGKVLNRYLISEGVSDNTINNIMEDNSGNLWFSANGGAYRFDGKKFEIFRTPQGMVDEGTNKIIQDKKGNFWFATHSGVSKFDGTGFTNLTPKQGLASDFVSTLIEDDGGDLWFGTEGAGVSRFDGDFFTTYTTKQGLAHNLIKDIIKDKSGHLWFATPGGICRFDGSGFYSLNSSQGLSDDVVSGLVEDEQGVIWFGTDKGISGLRFKTHTAENYSGEIKAAGLIKENNEILKTFEPVWENFNNKTGYPVKDLIERSMFIKKTRFRDGSEKDADVIWAGFSNGALVRFDPKSITRSHEKVVPYIQSVRINETPINWYSLDHKIRDSSIIAQQESMVYGKILSLELRDSLQRKFGNIRFDSITPFFQVPLNLILPKKNNQVTIDFGSNEITRSSMVHYQYKLDGYDNEWSPVTDKTSASFGNISEGDYSFLLKVRSPDGVWSDAISYDFKVLPPWWRTRLAYLSYFLLFSFLLYSVYRWRTRTLRKEKLRLEEKVGKRTSQLELKSIELERSLENLRSAQTQLVQSEKMASLGELTAGIAHEIQNPLNFVNNFSEVNAELIDEMQEQLAIGNLSQVKELSLNLKENEEKIIHHGKRADAIVKSMLQHSRSSSGKKELTEINELVDEYLRLAYHGLRAKDKSINARMETDFDPLLGKVDIIPQDIGRAILNLITNAFYAVAEKNKSNEPGYEPQVSVRTKKYPDRVEIAVKDNGNGIPKSVLDKIFQPFFTTKPTGQGTGLGLSLSYDIVKAHGGVLRFETKEGVGSEFVIQLTIT